MRFATSVKNCGSVQRFVPALALALMTYLSAPNLIIAQGATGDAQGRGEEKLLVAGDFSTLLSDTEWGESEEERKKILETIEVLVEVRRGAHTEFYDAAVETLQRHIAVILIGERTRPITRARVYFSRRNKDEVVATYEQAPIQESQTVTFFSPDFETLCKIVDTAKKERDCPATNKGKLTVTLHPAENVQNEEVKVLRADLAVVEFDAPVGYQAEAVIVTNPMVGSTGKSQSVLARALPGPRSVPGQPNISFTVLDPGTVKKNFGR